MDTEELADAVRRFVRAADIAQNRIAAHASLGVTDMCALGHIFDATEISPGDLAERLDMQPGSVTLLVRRLRESGLVHRQQSSEDLRRVSVTLTEAGQEIYGAAARRLIEAVGRVADGMGERDARAVATFLEGLIGEIARSEGMNL